MRLVIRAVALWLLMGVGAFAQVGMGTVPTFVTPGAGGGALACSYTPVTTGTQSVSYTGATPSASGGTPSYTFSESGSLPSGLSISSSTGIISGTPSVSGSFPSIQVKVTDSTSTVANCDSAFTLVIAPAVTYTGPGDIASGATHFWGLYAYNAAYATGSNPSIDIQDQAGGNTLTLNIGTDGFVDISPVAAWVTAHSVTTILVSKAYDQIGTNHITQSVLANTPTLVLSDIGSHPAVNFSASWLASSTSAAISQPFSLFAIAKRTTGTGLGMICGGGNATGIFFNSSAGALGLFAQSSVASFGTSVTENAYHSIQGLFNGASSIGAADGSSTTGLNPGTDTLGAPNWNNSSFNSTSRMMGWGVYPSDKSASFSSISSNDHTLFGF